MQIEENLIKNQRITISQREIEAILRNHIAKTFGDNWYDASCHLQKQMVKPYMGQIEDEYEIVANFKWTDSLER